MTQPNVSISLDRFKSAARSLRESVGYANGSLSHTQTLEALSHALFGKPYSEALHTVLADQSGRPQAASGSETESPSNTPLVYVEAYNICHDVDYDENGHDLPGSITFSFDLDDVLDGSESICHDTLSELISEAISGETGFCHQGFEFRITGVDSRFDPECGIHILHYGHESILCIDGQYVQGDFPGTDLNPGIEALETSAYIAAGYRVGEGKSDSVHEITLPAVLGKDYETDDILALADILGIFGEHHTYDPVPLKETVQLYVCPSSGAYVMSPEEIQLCGTYDLEIDLRHTPRSMILEVVMQWFGWQLKGADPDLFDFELSFADGSKICDPRAGDPEWFPGLSPFHFERVVSLL